MRRQIALVTVLVAIGFVPAASAVTSAGSLDKSFSNDGKALLSFGGAYERETANDVVVRSNGKILLAGELNGATADRWAVARLRANGLPDPTFSDNGRAVTVIGTDDAAYAVLPRSQGGMLVGGTSDGQWAVVAYTSSGGLDTSWGGDGIVTTPVPAGEGTVQHLRASADGSVLAAGHAGGRAVVVRYLSDGTPDDTYGTDGIVTAPDFAGEVVRVRVEPDGAILATGVSEFNEDSVTGVRTERYEADGDPLGSFGDAGGVTYFYPGTESGRGQVVLRQPDGKTLVAGSVFGEGDYRRYVVIRYLENGDPDPSFGPSNDSAVGAIRGLFDCCYAEAMDMQLQSDGKIVVAGWNEGDSPSGILVGRFRPSGLPDGGFGTRQGFRLVGMPSYGEAQALTISNGRIVVAGWAGSTKASAAMAVVRLHK